MRYALGSNSHNRKLLIVAQLFYRKDFSNENAKCVVFDLRLFLGTRWYHTRKVRLTVCCQHDRALASDIPLWPLQPPCLLTIRRTEFLLSMHKDKCMSHFLINSTMTVAEIHCSFSTSLYEGSHLDVLHSLMMPKSYFAEYSTIV